MLLHRPAMLDWILKALFGPLAADGVSTGGSDPATASPPAAATGHPSLKELKLMCAREWRAWPKKVGTKPFVAEQWNYFYPCEDPVEFAIGEIRDPYDGYVKSIFLEDNQKPLFRKGGLSP